MYCTYCIDIDPKLKDVTLQHIHIGEYQIYIYVRMYVHIMFACLIYLLTHM